MGINNIPPKTCTYSCVYCQLGRTPQLEVERRAFYDPEAVIRAVRAWVSQLREQGEGIDYLTFVPDGEPTLDLSLGQMIQDLKGLGIPIAVITNASLLAREDVREELAQADWVSLKLDAVSEHTWRWINRPHKDLRLEQIKEGMLKFAFTFPGRLATETMLVAGANDGAEELKAIAEFLERLPPDVAYLAVPTRPPAEPWVKPPHEEAVAQAYAVFSERLPRVELLIGYEGDAFSSTGDVAVDLLSITAVHPLRREAVEELLAKNNASWSVVQRLLDAGELVELDYQGNKFYMRSLPSRKRLR